MNCFVISVWDRSFKTECFTCVFVTSENNNFQIKLDCTQIPVHVPYVLWKKKTFESHKVVNMFLLNNLDHFEVSTMPLIYWKLIMTSTRIVKLKTKKYHFRNCGRMLPKRYPGNYAVLWKKNCWNYKMVLEANYI